MPSQAKQQKENSNWPSFIIQYEDVVRRLRSIRSIMKYWRAPCPPACDLEFLPFIFIVLLNNYFGTNFSIFLSYHEWFIIHDYIRAMSVWYRSKFYVVVLVHSIFNLFLRQRQIYTFCCPAEFNILFFFSNIWMNRDDFDRILIQSVHVNNVLFSEC